jgi:hypothetical protein
MEAIKVFFMMIWIFIEMPFKYLWSTVSEHPIGAVIVTLVSLIATVHFYFEMGKVLVLLIPVGIGFIGIAVLYLIYRHIKKEHDIEERAFAPDITDGFEYRSRRK